MIEQRWEVHESHPGIGVDTASGAVDPAPLWDIGDADICSTFKEPPVSSSGQSWILRPGWTFEMKVPHTLHTHTLTQVLLNTHALRLMQSIVRASLTHREKCCERSWAGYLGQAENVAIYKMDLWRCHTKWANFIWAQRSVRQVWGSGRAEHFLRESKHLFLIV